MIVNDKYCSRCIYKDTCSLTGMDATYCLVRYLLANVLGDLNKVEKKHKKKRYEYIIQRIIDADDPALEICKLYNHELNPLNTATAFCAESSCGDNKFDCDNCMYRYLNEECDDES